MQMKKPIVFFGIVALLLSIPTSVLGEKMFASKPELDFERFFGEKIDFPSPGGGNGWYASLTRNLGENSDKFENLLKKYGVEYTFITSASPEKIFILDSKDGNELPYFSYYTTSNNKITGYVLIEPFVYNGFESDAVINKIKSLPSKPDYLGSTLLGPPGGQIEIFGSEHDGYSEYYVLYKSPQGLRILALDAFYPTEQTIKVKSYLSQRLNSLFNNVDSAISPSSIHR